MSGIDRVDRVIGVMLLVVLSALAAVGLSENSHASSASVRAVSGPTSALGSSGTSPLTSLSIPTTTTPPTTTTLGPIPGPVTAVGDSIMLDIQPELSVVLPGVTVDGLVSRQFDAGVSVVQSDRSAGTLARVLVVELGTNGPVSAAGVDAMMQAASGVSRVVFVTVCVPRDWTAPNNTVLAAAVDRYPGTAVLADWNALATPHPEWFTADQVHLNPAGATALAGLIAHLA